MPAFNDLTAKWCKRYGVFGHSWFTSIGLEQHEIDLSKVDARHASKNVRSLRSVDHKHLRTPMARAFTLADLLVIIAVIVLLVGLLVPTLTRAKQSSQTIKDAAQITQIHRAFVIYANERSDGKLPTPGLINRQGTNIPPDGGVGTQQIQGMGLESYSLNNTANLYSACIAREMFSTATLIGPTEVNPIVVEKQNYDFTKYNPLTDKYWDPTFLANLYQPAGICNVSYAHQHIFGARKKSWSNTSGSRRPLVATRGTKNGAQIGNDYIISPTLWLHGTKEKWDGNVCFADNHTEFLSTFYPERVRYACSQLPASNDNIFAMDFPCDGTGAAAAARSGDAAMAFTIGSPTATNGAVVFDRLLP